MHQPYYGNPVTGKALLPWVRLHAAKDYWDMAALAAEAPDAHMTFNYVPSLLLQLEQYLSGELTDHFLELSQKDAESLIPEERLFILRNFFHCHWDHMIKPYPRYWDLLLERGRFVSEEDLQAFAGRATVQDMRDLQMWFNLTWFGHKSRELDPQLRAWISQGRNFSESDKQAMLRKQFDLMGALVPLLRERMQARQFEISMTPFYHPILPLLIDSAVAREAMPGVVLPEPPFKHPQDAQIQLRRSRGYYEKLFGCPVRGVWPSEGSVSQAVAELIAAENYAWMASDEEILAHATGQDGTTHYRSLTAQELFQPYTVKTAAGEVSMVFRDHRLSDRIGFVYAHWRPQDAVADFIGHLEAIARTIPSADRPPLVTIILDGENAWEHYGENGVPFLRGLYQALQTHADIRCVTVSEYLEAYPPRASLQRLFAGSWINHNFKIWIGHPEDNLGWTYIETARQMIETVLQGQASEAFAALSETEKARRFEAAWESIYIAEGSDWFWWYGDDHSSANDGDFDDLFRQHLKNVYGYLEEAVPEALFKPIKSLRMVRRPDREPFYLMDPKIDGKSVDYFEWKNAGLYQFEHEGGAMHQVQLVLTHLYYGFSLDQLFVRLDFHPSVKAELQSYQFRLRFMDPVAVDLEFQMNHQGWQVFKNRQEVLPSVVRAALGQCFETAIPFSVLAVSPNSRVAMVVDILRGNQVVDSRPQSGPMEFNIPGDTYEADKWYV